MQVWMIWQVPHGVNTSADEILFNLWHIDFFKKTWTKSDIDSRHCDDVGRWNDKDRCIIQIEYRVHGQPGSLWHLGALLLRWINFNPSVDKNHMPIKVWDEITYQFPNFNYHQQLSWPNYQGMLWYQHQKSYKCQYLCSSTCSRTYAIEYTRSL